MAVAVALMLPDLPENPGRSCPLGGMRMDQGVLTAVTMLGVLQLTCLTCAHGRWAAPRLQGWDLRGLLCWLGLAFISRVQGYTGWPTLPARALLETYALLMVVSAVPSLLLGGAARVESRTNGCVGRWSHRALVLLLVLRVTSAATLLGLGGYAAVPWETSLRYAYGADAGFVLALLLLCLALHLSPGGEASEADAVSVRRGARGLWMLAVLLVSVQETALMLVRPGERALEISSILSAYEYFGLVVAGASCFDAARDPLLAALPSKQASLLSKIQVTLALHDVLGSIPFDKPLFFSLRSALAKEEEKPAEPGLLRGHTTYVSVPAAGFFGPDSPAKDGKDSDGESIYGGGPSAV